MSFLENERQAIERAPFLFSDLPATVQERMVEREQTFDDWTAQRLFSQKREIYDVVVKMLALDMPVRLISDLCKVGQKTIVAVRAAEPDAVTAFRMQMSKRRVGMLHRCGDVIAAALENGSEEALAKAKDAAIVMNILDGQQRLDQGAPTQIVEVHQPPAVEKFREWMRGVIEVDAQGVPQTGLERGAGGAKGGLAGELGEGPTEEVKA